MFKVKQTSTSIRTIKSGDAKFHIVDGLVMAPRAGFEISSGCPYAYRQIIQECIHNGWLKPVANVKDNELFWEELER